MMTRISSISLPSSLIRFAPTSPTPTSIPPFPDMFRIAFDDSDGYYTLNQSTFYRLTPPSTGPRAADSSTGWLFKASQSTNPNTFSLLVTLSASTKQHIPPGTLPNPLNLLDYGISEIGKSYSVEYHGTHSPIVAGTLFIKKVIALWDFLADCRFAALALRHGFRLSYWKLGDEDWTPIDSGEYYFTDVILSNGKCYAVNDKGLLVSFDSEWNLTVIAPMIASPMPCRTLSAIMQNYLVESGLDLFLVSKISAGLLLSDDWTAAVNFELMLTKFNKDNGYWNYIGDAGDMVFVLCDEASLCVSAKDYGGCKGNTAYLTDDSFNGYKGNVDRTGVYHLGDKRAFSLPMALDFGKISWPPPSWLCASASSSTE